ncbi:MAG: tRNA uridine-5-carboxymethylaminomethyl(34) synthesis GTPase MnmE [Gammaproteobacteria bacterium]|jgi:tRNA modification GTPase|nr:tRNA uridine-5-carboxymethylaminomethyl(34) synthesis GTPase MnmE [Gammaproteobacteria bacterium]MBT3861074.1 tRNA uridine-5-carboxymethylaminomethyl(34) synthesis GTPase MnmE [Gammaproteobacteria bacterium]MBT3987716.1 tRNA uridine-5-carboxymethylaminomethyl(34) synthesis GTPase MnmE [Gammaproteobacteria bacterium]MBT4582704.1 tRNA uridine-5-carboxymethylaminomethyl(34) synthesis GTPase MnmE [Gammaproteobacteria bacterium]MBT4657968.1 tRNA uridine-5-carboxymethylaminomethyl(34) synthesis GT
MPQFDTDTICAIATSPGRSGVGIVRVSGPAASDIAKHILGLTPKPRYAHYCDFLDQNQQTIDQGIALFFDNPHSFTGEDVLELQGHGGIHVLQSILSRVLNLGARLARPGEFSERSFINNKIDLLQAEAIADLIDASSQQAARSAIRTLQGEFSKKIHKLVENLVKCRVNVEAAIDFSDEDIDVLSDTRVKESIQEIESELDSTLGQAEQGALLKEGIKVVIAGKPNAGKSSLLNALSGIESAIVTDVPGTTRDVLSEEIAIDGLPVHIVDTAGLRHSEDRVEQEGIRRAQQAIEEADQILLLLDSSKLDSISEEAVENLLENFSLLNDKSIKELFLLENTAIVLNKVDLIDSSSSSLNKLTIDNIEIPVIGLSAKNRTGLDGLREHLKMCCGYHASQESSFVARERHLLSLREAKTLIDSALQHLDSGSALELIAEDLRLAQSELGKITGEFTSDDLLGEIFSNFCVGK